MIEIDYSLLTQEALDNLINEVIARQSMDYDEDVNLITKKAQLLQKLELGKAIIVYHSKDGFCDIVSTDSKDRQI